MLTSRRLATLRGPVRGPDRDGRPRPRVRDRWRPGGARGSSDLLRCVTEVAAAVRSGAGTEDAWRRAGVATEDGVPRWDSLMRRSGTQTSRAQAAAASAVLAAAVLSHDVGAAPGTVLDRLAASLAEEGEVEVQRRAAFAGPRSTAQVLAWLPALGVLLGLALGADPVGVLLDGGAGTAMLGAALVLTAVGRRWTRRRVRAAALVGDVP